MNPARGILLKVMSVLGFTLMAACIKAVSEVVPTVQACFFRAFFALLTIVAVLTWQREFPAALYTSNPWAHVWRGALGLTAMLLNFASLGLLPLPDAIAIGYAAPLFVTLIAALVLGEDVRIFRWTAVVVGLVGVTIILWPRLSFLKGASGSERETIGALFALTGALVVAIGTIVVSRMVSGERTSAIVFYFSAFSSVGFLLTAPFGWAWPDQTTLALMILSGVLGGVAQLLVTESYRYAAPTMVAPFEYTSMLFGIVLGVLLFGEWPTWSMLLGSLVVVAAGLMVLWRERVRRVARVAPSAWHWTQIGVEKHDG